MQDYILATKFYNESKRLPTLIADIAAQTHRPRKLVFIDDGSIDNSGETAILEARKWNLDCEMVSMPKKKRGNLDTLGRAWNKAQPLLKKLASDTKYFATTDVDSEFPQDYFETMTAFLEANPSVGVVGGQLEGSYLRTFPMFTGKTFRAAIIMSIDKYWDISIDSFVNIKALKLGYELRILDAVKVKSPPSHLQSGKGRFRAGRLAYYGGIQPLYAISKGIARRDASYLRGYWSEFSRASWKCNDRDILAYYQSEMKRKILRYARRLLRA